MAMIVGLLNKERARARGILASTLRLPPNPCKKVQEKSHGWTRENATMHSQTCMVPLGNLHGWTSQLAWLDSRKCMVARPRFHGSAFACQSIGIKSTVHFPKSTASFLCPPPKTPCKGPRIGKRKSPFRGQRTSLQGNPNSPWVSKFPS